MSEQCPKISAIGTPCDLEAGHAGDHQRSYPDGRTVTWNADADHRFINKQTGKGLGT